MFVPSSTNSKSLKISSDFRIISSTNRDLQTAIEEKQFRSDLYFRLNQFKIVVPPLRDRKSDIVELVDFFAQSKGHQRNISKDMTDSIDILKKYPWPGNVRELFNALERAFLLADNGIPQITHFPAEINNQSVNMPVEESESYLLEDLENAHILKVYHDMGNNRTLTAKALGISVRSLFNKLKIIENIKT